MHSKLLFQTDNLVKHIALGHSKLDEFLMDEDLVARKRQQILTRRKTTTTMAAVGVGRCPICFVDSPSREHLVRHFMEELLEIVENESGCEQCEYW